MLVAASFVLQVTAAVVVPGSACTLANVGALQSPEHPLVNGTSFGPDSSHVSPVPFGSSWSYVAWYQVTRRLAAPSVSPFSHGARLMLVSGESWSSIWF